MKGARKTFMAIMVLAALPGLAPGFAQANAWRELHVGPAESVWASSSLTETVGGRKVTYGPEALFDRDPATPWVEGSEGSGVGETITFLTNRTVRELRMTNGFARSQRLYYRNNRVKSVKVAFVAGFTAPGLVTELDYTLFFVRARQLPALFRLKDSMIPQTLLLQSTLETQESFYSEVLEDFAGEHPQFFAMILADLGLSEAAAKVPVNQKLIMEVYGFFALELTIDEVYPGSHYDDTCISEIEFELEDL